jgi:hypothetical protein
MPTPEPFVAWAQRFPTAKTRPLDFAAFPFQREMYEVFGDPAVEDVAVMKSAQVGVSELCARVTLYFPDVLALTSLYVFPALKQMPLKRDLAPVEEASQFGARRIPSVPEHQGARRRRLGRDPLQPTRAAHPLGRQPPDLLGDVGRDRRNAVVLVRLDSHHTRGICGAKPDGEQRPERDRDLAEDVARPSLADDAVDPVDDLHRFDATVEQRKQRALVALVRRVFARRETDVGRGARKPLARRPIEVAENADTTNVVCRHHERNTIARM